MGLALNLLEFAIGETIRFDVLAKERDGTALASPASATFAMNIGTNVSDTSLYIFNASPEVELTDVPTSRFTVLLPTATIPLLLEGTIYKYDIYTTSAGDALHQVGGVLVLKAAIEP